MSFPNYKYGTGLRNVGSYQVSGHPYITGSADLGAADTEHVVSFPYVTKEVKVIASGSSVIKVHFNPASAGSVLAGNHFITLDDNNAQGADNVTLNVKCKELYITTVTANAAFQLYASLTNIDPSHMYTLTGSGLTHASNE